MSCICTGSELPWYNLVLVHNVIYSELLSVRVNNLCACACWLLVSTICVMVERVVVRVCRPDLVAANSLFLGEECGGGGGGVWGQ